MARNPYWTADLARDALTLAYADEEYALNMVRNTDPSTSYISSGIYESTLGSNDYMDWISVNLQHGAIYNIAVAGSYLPSLTIYDSSGYLLSYTDGGDLGIDEGNTLDSIVEFTASYTGLHYLTVTWEYSQGYFGYYSLGVDSYNHTPPTVNSSPSGQVSISGNAKTGETLLASHNLSDADGLGTVSYQWKLNGTNIAGETSDSLVLNQSHLGGTISVQASYRDGRGNDESVVSTSTSAVMNGGPTNQSVFGTSSDDSLQAADGDDTFYGSPGNDSINGGDGIDSTIYNTNASNYVIYRSGDSVVVKKGDGTADTLSDIERLKFSDKEVALDIDSANSAGGIYRTYKAAFDRTPDGNGLGYWISRADEGLSAVAIAEGFVWSDEFQSVYNVTTSDNYLTGNNINQVVDSFYRNVLDRAPDQGGLNYYVDTITNQEKTVGQVLAEIADSSENRNNLIEIIGNGIEYDLWTG